MNFIQILDSHKNEFCDMYQLNLFLFQFQRLNQFVRAQSPIFGRSLSERFQRNLQFPEHLREFGQQSCPVNFQSFVERRTAPDSFVELKRTCLSFITKPEVVQEFPGPAQSGRVNREEDAEQLTKFHLLGN